MMHQVLKEGESFGNKEIKQGLFTISNQCTIFNPGASDMSAIYEFRRIGWSGGLYSNWSEVSFSIPLFGSMHLLVSLAPFILECNFQSMIYQIFEKIKTNTPCCNLSPSLCTKPRLPTSPNITEKTIGFIMYYHEHDCIY